jgi:hypothetical protein
VYIEKGKEEETNQFGGKIKTKRGGEILKEQQQHEEVLFFLLPHTVKKRKEKEKIEKKRVSGVVEFGVCVCVRA